jgi:FkbM family methyltransferase
MSQLISKVKWRAGFLLGDNPFSLRERLAYINPLGQRLSLEELISRSRRCDPDGTDYYRLDGLKLYFRPDFPITDEDEFRFCTELVLRESYLYHDAFSEQVQLRPGDYALDLGGNIGTVAIMFSRLVGSAGRVFAFEPLTHPVLRRNLEANGIDNVELIPDGVSDQPGEAEINFTDQFINSSIANATPGDGALPIHKRKITLTTVDRFVAERGLDRVDFIKMDIEGAEESALRGSREVIERFRPKWSIASYHIDFEGELQHPKLVRLLRDFDYRIEEVEQDGRMVRIFAW